MCVIRLSAFHRLYFNLDNTFIFILECRLHPAQLVQTAAKLLHQQERDRKRVRVCSIKYIKCVTSVHSCHIM